MEGKKNLHFGVLLSTIDNICQCRIWEGIVEYAKMNDINLTAYIGTYQTTGDDFDPHYETCFETIKNSNSLDGIILFAGFIAEDIGLENFQKYVERIPKNVPIVSVSYVMPGVSSVLADNTDGIFRAVEHLIKCHGKKNIAFVKGPDGHSEAEERMAGYKKALEENGLTFDEKYVLPGHFSQESGQEAVEELIDKRGLPFDAIVASDDETAIGVLNELNDRHIMVPTTVAVTGFDDDRASATFIPSISTARQEFFNIGLQSATMLHKQVGGIFSEEAEKVKYVESFFVPRQSCGCLEKEMSTPEWISGDTQDATNSFYPFVLRKFRVLFRHDVPAQQIHQWATAIVENIKGKPFIKEKFLHLFNEILVNYNNYSKDFSVWHEALDILTMGIEVYKEEIVDTYSILATLNFATTLVHDIRVKERKIKEFETDDLRLVLRRVAGALVLIFDIDSLAEELYRSLPELSIDMALIGLYHSPIKSSDTDGVDRTIDTLIGFDGERKFNIKHNSWNPIVLSDYSTIDRFDFESKRRSLFFIPLFFKDEELGVLLLPYDSSIPSDAYETLRVNISTAVKGAELLSKIQTLSITDELTGLLNRRGFFQFVYSRMQHLYRRTEIISIVMFMDMDGLKFINDTYGHKEGDIAISAFAKILKDTLREEDIIGRMGGDEFVVFSSVKSRENAYQVVERIRAKLDEYNAKKLHVYNVSGSIGSVVLDSATKECFEAAMLSADSVLYEEKMEKKKKGLSRQ
ncbi:MAG: GGDEF domain-containing protein [Chitinivibrionia bacterium]|nr:GGDEF domain-containing protein [Chitinivibrionia bacterium]